ncbi:MAG: glycosyltransferase [Clostridia bacterium]|nr:glycosyltransferase [Clostridia bacterium]
MKIVYIDINTLGHHIPYISALVNGCDNEAVAILPQRVEELNCRQYKYETSDRKNGKRSFLQFKKWINEIYEYVEKENPDVVHFLNADFFYRYFGYGLNKFKKYKTVTTMHCLRDGFLNKMSAKMISSSVDSVVLHSEFLKDKLSCYGKTNGVHIEYPNFKKSPYSKTDDKEYYGLDVAVPVLGCIGETRNDKGLDIMLEALRNVKYPFQLLVAGKPVHFDEEYIKEKTAAFSNKVRTKLEFLSDEDFLRAINATDIIVVPYRKVFDAASGPLGEGVALGRCIVGPDHGNLCNTITKNHLGYTFESENPLSLAETLNEVLQKEFVTDEVYENYRKTLDVSCFLNSYNNLYNSL